MADTKISELTSGTPQDTDEIAGQRGATQNFRYTFLAIRTFLEGFFPTDADLTAHTGDATVHFTEASIDHDNISNNGTNTHAQIDAHIGDATVHFTEGSIDHTAITNVGTNTHAQIDTHIADATVHFTEASIDHTAIQNVGTNSHAQIDTHIANTSNPHGVTAAQAGAAPSSHVGAGGAAHANFTTGGVAGFAPGSSGGTTEFLRADGNWAEPPGAGGGEANTQTNLGGHFEIGLPKSGVDLPLRTLRTDNGSMSFIQEAESLVLRSIPQNVLNSQLANMLGNTVKMRQGASTGDPQDVEPEDVANGGTMAAADVVLGQKAGGDLAHFTGANIEAGIDHDNIANNGTNTHAQIDAHIGAGGATHPNFTTGGVAGFAPGSSGGSTDFLRADGVWAPPPGAGGGEANTASNVGGFAEVFQEKVGVDFEFRTLQSSDGYATVTQNADDVDITAPTNVVYVAPGGDVTAAIDAASAGTIIQLGVGAYTGTNFKFDAKTDVTVRGMGRETVVNCTPSAVGTPPNRHPGSLNFSNNTRCTLSNMRVVLTDDGTQNTLSFGAIERASNTACQDCILENLWIEVGEMDVGRTTNSAMLWGIGYIPADNAANNAYGLMLRNIEIVSSCSGVRDTDGEMHLHNVDIWYGNTARTDTPNLIGFDDHRGGRSYYWSGKCTTGYGTVNPNTDAAVYSFRANQSTSGGRTFLFDVVAFARNDGAGASRAIYVQRDGSNDPWYRIEGGYYQAETTGGVQVEAIQTNWTPADGNEAKVEIISGRVGGVVGNTIGHYGRTVWNAAATISSNTYGTWLADTDGAAFTWTMHSQEGTTGSGTWHFKNIGGSGNDLTLAVGSGDTLDGVTDGTLTLKDNECASLIAEGVSGSVINWRIVGKSKRLVYRETKTWTIGGAYTAGTDVAKIRIKLAANQTARLVAVDRINSSGTGTVTVNKNDVAIAAYSSLAVSATWAETTGSETLVTNDDLDLVIDASTSGTVLSVGATIEYEVSQ